MLFDFKWKVSYIKANKQYLRKGRYCFLPNLRTVVERRSRKTLRNLFPDNPISRRSKIKLFFANLKSINVARDGELFRANAVYFSNTGRDADRVIKFFDYSAGKVLTVCQNSAQFEKYFYNRDRYSRFYPVPRLLEKDAVKTRYIEEYIDKTSFPQNEEKAIYQNLTSLFSSLFEKNEYVFKKCEYDIPSALKDDIQSAPSFLKTFEQHGDLSIDNFICTNNGIVFIDFEHQGEYPIFYDLLFLITNSYIVNGKRTGIELFEQGFFDNYFAMALPDYETPVTDVLVSFILVFHEKRIKHISHRPIYGEYMDLFRRMIRNKNGK